MVFLPFWYLPVPGTIKTPGKGLFFRY